MLNSASADPLLIQRLVARALGAAAIVALLVCWWQFLVAPLNEAWQALEQDRIEVESLHLQQPVLAAALQASQASTETWQQISAQLQQRAMPAQDDIDFLDWINEQAQATGLSIKDFRPSGRDSVGDYEGRGLLLSTSGSFDSICKFLEAMRHCPRMNRITSVEIVPEGNQRESFAMSLRVVLFTRATKTAFHPIHRLH